MPAGHVYVRHLARPSGPDPVVRLADPPPLRATRAETSQWWPPAMLDPQWIGSHADEFDLMHVHFGFDAVDPAELERVADALAQQHKPLVVTAHDLRNPHHPEPGLHRAQLGVLLRRADRVITLTAAAAAALRAEWGVEALVLPHPHVVTEQWLARPRPAHDGFVVGVHCKSLRANLDPLPVIEVVLAARSRIPDLRLRVDVHTDVMTPGMANHHRQVSRMLQEWTDAGLIELHVHDYFADDELYAYLQGLDVSILPYRFGSHSGWLEACKDLGTWTAAPTCGFYADQGDVLSFAMDENGFDGESLLRALEGGHRGPAPRETIDGRLEQRRRIAHAHEELYSGLL